MKKFLTLALSALLTMGLLTACGGKTTDKTVDLTAFYNTLAEEYGWRAPIPAGPMWPPSS